MLLNCSGITVKYNNIVAVEDVDFQVNKREFITVLGQNGSGKTSLIKAILGTLPLSKGEVEWEKGIKRSYIGQNIEIKSDFPAKVKEVIASGNILKNGFLFSSKERRLVFKSAEKLGITDILDKSFKELSGGQRQRVLIARAIVGNPDILFFDEPVNNLDENVRKDFYDILKELKANGKSVVIITHDFEKIKDLCDKVLVLDKKVLFFNTVTKYYKFFGKSELQS